MKPMVRIKTINLFGKNGQYVTYQNSKTNLTRRKTSPQWGVGGGKFPLYKEL